MSTYWISSTELRTTLGNYQDAFRDMAQAREKMGLDHNSGLHGKLRKAVHEVEEILKTHDQIALSHSMLMMRRHEKDYLARKLDKYLQKMADEQKRFAGLLEESDLVCGGQVCSSGPHAGIPPDLPRTAAA